MDLYKESKFYFFLVRRGGFRVRIEVGDRTEIEGVLGLKLKIVVM